MASGKIIGIISLKGGVGKTTAVANLGAILAQEFGKKVLLVDANFGAPNLGLHVGLIDPKTTLHHVLNDRADVGDAIYPHGAGFHVIPASFIERKVNPFRLKQKIGHLKNSYDLILVDSSPNLNDEVLATMIASDELLVVTTPDYPTLSTTLRAVKLAKQKRTPITGIILNKVRNKGFELSLEEIEDAAGVPVLSVLPDDINVLEALSATTPVALHKGMSNASIELKKLAASLVGESFEDPRWWKRVQGMLGKGYGKDQVNRELLKNDRI